MYYIECFFKLFHLTIFFSIDPEFWLFFGFNLEIDLTLLWKHILRFTIQHFPYISFSILIFPFDLQYESNARFVRWSDGSLQLLIGNEVLDISVQDAQHDQAHLFLRHGKVS